MVVSKDYVYYVPNTFRIGRCKNSSSTFLVKTKNCLGNWSNKNYFKEMTGYNLSDTGKSSEDLIIKEASGAVKDYDNVAFKGIKVGDFQHDMLWLEHPLGFRFRISINNFILIVLGCKRSINDHRILGGKYYFATHQGTEDTWLVPDNVDGIFFEKDKDKQVTIKEKDLVVGKLYRYYDSLREGSHYCDLMYLGKFEYGQALRCIINKNNQVVDTLNNYLPIPSLKSIESPLFVFLTPIYMNSVQYIGITNNGIRIDQSHIQLFKNIPRKLKFEYAKIDKFEIDQEFHDQNPILVTKNIIDDIMNLLKNKIRVITEFMKGNNGT